MIIVIEGIDGAGKSSVCEDLFSFYHLDAEFLRTPGGAFKEVRELVLNPDYDLDKMAKLFFFLGEMIHLTNKIDPSSGKDYIFDRFFPSTFIYQFLMREHEIPHEKAKILNDIFLKFMPKIDLTVVLTVDTEVGMSRSSKHLEFGKKDAFEAEGIGEWERRRFFYESLGCTTIKDKLGEVLLIDTTNLPIWEVSNLILDKITEMKR